MSNPNQRRNLLINKTFQLKFMAYTLLPTLISQAVLWLALDYYLQKMLAKGKEANLPQDHFYYQLISEQLELMRNIFSVVGVISVLVIIIWALFISNKIAGPFYRLTQMLERSDPYLKNIKFRPGDFFPEVAEALSRYLTNKKEE
jgi:hypothetical protein